MSLFRPDELLSVKGFLKQQFGREYPEAHEVSTWRLAETKQMLGSAPFAITNYFRVADKDGNLTTIQPFVGQAILSVAIESQRRRGFPQRVIECKPRQIGWTTWCLGEALHTVLHPNRKAMVLVNDEDVAGAKATIIATMLNGLPGHMQPKRRIQNLKHLFFDNPNPKERIYDPGLNSELLITVPSGMRGSTPHVVIISEYAHMDDDRKEEVNSGLLTGMGLRKAACVIIDTTPLGFDDDYYPMMMEAADDNPKWIHKLENTVQLTAQDVFDGKLGEPDRPDGWVPAFSTWFVHDEYCTRNENPRGEWPRITKAELAEFLHDLGKNSKYAEGEEQELYERGVSPYRLYWRRRKIDSIKQPSQELKLLVFRQEFASTVASSFVNYDKSPFDRECLDAVVRQAREPLARGIMREEGGRIGIDTTYHSDWQEVRIYDGPRSSEQYAIGVDTGVRYGSKDSDAWVAQVLRGSNFEIVATYEARVDDFTFIEQLLYLYRFYNHAYTAVELQAAGYALVRRLIDAGMRNYYCWKRMDAEIPEPTKYPGWETSLKTRPIMDDWLVTTICHRDPNTNRPEPLVTIPDRKTLAELQSVRRQSSGAIKAESGHDDHVDALALAMIAAADPWSGINNPFKAAREQPKEEKPDNFAMFARKWRGQSLGRTSRNRPDLAQL